MEERNGLRTNYIGNPYLRVELKCCIISNIRVNIPQWKRDLSLAPLWIDVKDLKDGKISFEEFSQRYRDKVLSKTTQDEVYKKYKGWYVLCCEKEYTECYRSVFGEWMREGGYDCEEGLF